MPWVSGTPVSRAAAWQMPSEAVLDSTVQEIVIVDVTGATGYLTMTQTSGTTASVSGPLNHKFMIYRPAGHTDILTFELRSNADGPTDATTEVIVYPLLTSELVLGDGDPEDLESWS